MEWKEAILAVLKTSSEPCHYAEIAEEVAKRKLRRRNELGATPANTVAVTIGNSLRNEGDKSPFVRATRGYYTLREAEPQAVPSEEVSNAIISPVSGIVNALGMFWEKSKVAWKIEPKLLGRQQQDSKTIDFSKQIGVYLLHDAQGVVYVGRAIDQPIGRRLQQHTVDRLNGRWDRFSWFGIYPVEEDGSLRTDIDTSLLSLEVIVSTLEAILIEGLEPRQNRRRGDAFQPIEFLQFEDPSIEEKRAQSMLSDLLERAKASASRI